jgi:hypothetical protein
VGNIDFSLPLDGGGRWRAKILRKRLTDAERLLWTYLRAKQLEGLKFRRQEPIGKYIHPPLNPLPSREGKVVCDTPIQGWETTHLK